MSAVSTIRPRRLRAWLPPAALLLCATFGNVSLSRAQQQPVSEYQVKAAFLYNFAKFVDWPPEAFRDPSAPIVMCIEGDDPFGNALDQTVRDKTVNGRAFFIRRGRQLPELKQCHILFISSSERRRLPEIFSRLQGAGVLTVGESERFASSGGVVQFALEDNRVHLVMNPDAAARARLKVSSKLLAIATIVPGDPQPGKE